MTHPLSEEAFSRGENMMLPSVEADASPQESSMAVEASREVAPPEGQYRTIVADPPWEPSLGATWKTRYTDKARPQKHYDVMPLDAICTLPVPSAKQSHLYLWCLNQHVDWGYQVAEAWGFEPVQLLTWAKPGLGVGRFQCNTEQILVARKGSRHGNPFGATGGTWFNWPRGIHSEKPNEFYKLVESCSPGPYLEMFSRKSRSGWDAWGLEIGKLGTASNEDQPELFGAFA